MPLRSWAGVLRMEPLTGWWPTAGMKTGVTMVTSRSSVAPTSVRSRTPSSTVAPWLVCPRPPIPKRWSCEALAKRQSFQWLANFDPAIENQCWLRVDWSHPRGFWSRVWHLSVAREKNRRDLQLEALEWLGTCARTTIDRFDSNPSVDFATCPEILQEQHSRRGVFKRSPVHLNRCNPSREQSGAHQLRKCGSWRRVFDPFYWFIATTVEKNIDLRHGFLKIYQAMKATSFPRGWKLANFRPGSRCCLFFLLFVAVPME